MTWWRSGYRARLEILFPWERQFESGPRRNLFLPLWECFWWLDLQGYWSGRDAHEGSSDGCAVFTEQECFEILI
jgi:hypothetical protein